MEESELEDLIHTESFVAALYHDSSKVKLLCNYESIAKYRTYLLYDICLPFVANHRITMKKDNYSHSHTQKV